MQATTFVARHLGEPLSLADIAAAACKSPFHFARLFRARAGCSPMQYVRHLRLERAREMLLDEDSCIAHTAAALGFYDQSHFTRVFRRVHGESPGVFRHRARAARAHLALPISSDTRR